ANWLFAVSLQPTEKPLRRDRDCYPVGYCSNFGIAGSIWSHGCASEVKRSICGRNQLGSSKLPAATPTTSKGVSDSAPVNREPHWAQKPHLCFPRLTLSVK